MLVQSPEPEAHDKVLNNNPDRIGIWTDENQQTQPTYDAESGNQTQATLVGGLRGR